MSKCREGDIVHLNDRVMVVEMTSVKCAYVVDLEARTDSDMGLWIEETQIDYKLTGNQVRSMLEKRERAIVRLRRALRDFIL